MWPFATRGSRCLGDAAARHPSRPDLQRWILFQHASQSADVKHLAVLGIAA